MTDAQRQENVRNTELLNAELPDERFVDESYLHWLYDENPLGPGFQESVDEDGVRVAHYALIPQVYRSPDGPEPFIFSLNAVSRSGAQRKGYFGMLQLRVWSRARDAGVVAGIGVTNARSHRGVEIMGWRMVGQMPVQIVLPSPVRPKGWQSWPVQDNFVDSPTFKELSVGLDDGPVEHWTHSWTPEYLRWRLASPNGARFAVHASDELFAVSTASAFRGVPVAVIVKLLVRGAAAGPVSGHAAVSEACRFHRAPAAVYAGFNKFVSIKGVPAPERLKPAPLNLEFCSLTDRIRQDEFILDTFEFLDMDAY
ncbi:MAG: hypothetical protein HYX32_08965 [Actinobacteria bacterium]|nr:hypothetical protein [Actinomycetota bacterium]